MELSKIQKWGISLGIIVLSLTFITMQLSSLSRDASLSDWAQGMEGFIKTSRLQSESGKPMALFFYTDWCPNCKKLREEILTAPEVRDYMADIHTVKVNPETGVLENKLAEDFGVIGYPSFFIVDAKAESVKQIRRTANITPAQFIAQIQAARVAL